MPERFLNCESICYHEHVHLLRKQHKLEKDWKSKEEKLCGFPAEDKLYDLPIRIVRFEIADSVYETLYTNLIPAVTGFGAPYWNEKAMASISGITRMTGKAEIVKEDLECIAYQITDLVQAMEKDARIEI